MPKGFIKPERVAGIVALSYLVLIPAGAFYAWQKIQMIDRDVTDLWEKAGYPPHESRGVVKLDQIRETISQKLRGERG